MNAFSAASRFRKELADALRVTKAAWQVRSDGMSDDEAALLWKQMAAQTEQMMWDQTRETMRVAWQMQQMMLETREEILGASHSFMVTLRPKDGMTLDVLYSGVRKMLERKVFVKWQCAFEQKGTDVDSLGAGMHVHVVAQCSARKAVVLQAVLGQCRDGKWVNGALCSWINDGLLEPNCVDVRPCKNPTAVVQRYLVDYESDDGHKAVTKEWDALWRDKMGLLPLYNSDQGLVVCLSSPDGTH